MEGTENRYVAGIDVGGQTSKIGIVGPGGDILARRVIRSDCYGADFGAYISALSSAVSETVSEAGIDGVAAVGAGAPNANHYSGMICSAPNLEWASGRCVDFVHALSSALGGIPVSVTNDANAAALGERRYGVAAGMDDFIMITLGTGVGSGIVAGGRLLYGHDSLAGELGHTCAVREGGRPCGCGKTGCLETYCSATGVARTAREWLGSSAEPSLLRSVQTLDSKAVYEAARQGDPLALRIFEYTGTILGRSLADFVAFSSPEAIVLFGGLARAREFLQEPVKTAMDDNLLPVWKGRIKLLFSTLRESDAAILGAAALAWEDA